MMVWYCLRGQRDRAEGRERKMMVWQTVWGGRGGQESEERGLEVWCYQRET